jgi:hypothetical protein
MAREQKLDLRTERETIERRESALKRMLATPHKPHMPLKKKTAKKKKAEKP